jgi:hypothetical protein
MKKLFKFKNLFEYYEYLEKIDELDIDSVKKMSETIDSHIISEGLITTYPLEKSIQILKRRFNDYNISVGEDNEIYIEGVINHDYTFALLNTLGYHITSIIQNDKQTKLEELLANQNYVLCAEPKYDIKDIVPEIIFHATLSKYVNKINKIGIIPKSNNKISLHPDRIYFSIKIEDAIKFAEYLENKYDTSSAIVVVSTIDLDNNFYSDINFKYSGVYTLNNISPKNIIKIIKK